MPLTVDPALGPAIGISDLYVGALLDDGPLAVLLFPAWAPRTGPDDDRVYRSNADLPRDPAIRSPNRPTVVVEVRLDPRSDEQPDLEPTHAAARLYFYVTVPADRELHGRAIMQRIKVIASTPQTAASIIAARLYPVNDTEVPERVPALDNSWQFRAEYRSPSVGVIP